MKLEPVPGSVEARRLGGGAQGRQVPKRHGIWRDQASDRLLRRKASSEKISSGGKALFCRRRDPRMGELPDTGQEFSGLCRDPLFEFPGAIVDISGGGCQVCA